VRCPACGSENPETAAYCADCGQRIGEAPLYVPPAAPAPPPATAIGLPSGNDPAGLETARALGWNWGGFLLPYLWLVGHGRASFGILLVLSSFLPLVSAFHLLLYPAFAIYLGLNGYETAWRHAPYHSVEQLRDREREWMFWGFIAVIVFLVSVLLFAIYFGTFFMDAMRELEGMAG
jgi:hypothetical protein